MSLLQKSPTKRGIFFKGNLARIHLVATLHCEVVTMSRIPTIFTIWYWYNMYLQHAPRYLQYDIDTIHEWHNIILIQDTIFAIQYLQYICTHDIYNMILIQYTIFTVCIYPRYLQYDSGTIWYCGKQHFNVLYWYNIDMQHATAHSQ